MNATVDLSKLLHDTPSPPGPGCVIARWRAALDDTNRDALDELLTRARTRVIRPHTLWRALRQEGMEASAASFTRHLQAECSCPTATEAP